MSLSQNPAFYGPRLKIRRAYHHISDLNREFGKFFSGQGASIRIEDDYQTHKRAVVVERHKPIPEDFGLILGDAVHNLRAALDLATWEVLLPFKAHPPSSIQFPVGGGKDSRRNFFEQALSNRKIKGTTHEIERTFAEMEVYEGGDGDEIWRLHRLDVTDKHEIIIPTIHAALLHDFSPHKVDPSYQFVRLVSHGASFQWVGRSEPQKLMEWPLTDQSTPIKEVKRRFKEHTNKGKTFDIAFGGEPRDTFPGNPIIPTLHRVANKVSAIVDRIAAI